MQTATVNTGAETRATTVNPAAPAPAALANAGALQAAFKAVKPALAGGYAINPVLTYARLRISDGSGSLMATDGDFTFLVPLAGETAGELDLLLPGKLTADALKAIPADALVSLTVKPGEKNPAVLIEGGGRSFSLGALWPENYPENPAAGELVMSLPISVLARALRLTCFAACKESGTGAIHYTNGVFMACRAGACDVVATDGHRLGLVKLRGIAEVGFDFETFPQVANRDHPGYGGAMGGLLIPAAVACALLKALPDDPRHDRCAEAAIYHRGNTVTFSLPGYQYEHGRGGAKWLPGFTIASSLLDVKFPDYLRVLQKPEEVEAKLHCFRLQLIDALQAVLPITRKRDQNPVARLSWTADRLTLKSDGGECGTGETSIPVEATAAGEVAVNPCYLIDALKAAAPGEQVTLSWISNVNPVQLTAAVYPDFTYIVMPIRLDD